MYSITEILIQLLFCIVVFKSSVNIFFLKRYLSFFYENINEFIYFYYFMCENNPLLLNYLDDAEDILHYENIKTNDGTELIKQEEKFENKYLEKFKKFPNEFIFDEQELNQEKEEYNKIKIQFGEYKFESIKEIQQELSKIKEITNNAGFREKTDNENDSYTASINSNGIDLLLNYFDMIELYEDNPDDINFEELYIDLLNKREKLLKKITELESMRMTDDEARSKARDLIVNKKLDKFIDNYILEYTPLGNIYMRYNNNKKSFEYFSNNSIPYRYLEPVGRKYVMTYWCKPIFVDIEEELKKAEQVYEKKKDEDKKKEEKKKEEKKKEDEKKEKYVNPKNILVKLKEYNKGTQEQKVRPMKNRSDKNAILQSQIKNNLPQVNKTSEKQLLKENANRYTWEGRLTNFCPLKKIDKKVLDKKLNMTYSEFKKLQQEQNKKYI